MNANFKWAAQFGRATIIGVLAGWLVLGISRFLQAPPEYPMHMVRPGDAPALIVFFITMALGVLAGCFAVAGVIQVLLNRGSVQPAEPNVPQKSGFAPKPSNSDDTEGPPQVR